MKKYIHVNQHIIKSNHKHNKYIASEIDKHALEITKRNFTQFLTSPGHSLILIPDDGTFMIPNN